MKIILALLAFIGVVAASGYIGRPARLVAYPAARVAYAPRIHYAAAPRLAYAAPRLAYAPRVAYAPRLAYGAPAYALHG